MSLESKFTSTVPTLVYTLMLHNYSGNGLISWLAVKVTY